MNRIFSLLLLSFFFFGLSYGKQIDENTAKNTVFKFLKTTKKAQAVKSTANLIPIYKATSIDQNQSSLSQSITYYYVFNTSNGFVIVSGDDNVFPILGYSEEGNFQPNNIPSQVAKWLEGYKSQIQYVIDKGILATNEIKSAWYKEQNDTDIIRSSIVSKAVLPILKTKWDQSPYYNDLCPFDKTANERTVSGCVATAMAQILKFWNYPAQGTGFHSYNDKKYGTLSANFGSTTYQWNSMPNVISNTNNSVATLMYHCGVSVNMSYGVAATGGSGAYVVATQSPVTNCAEYALKTYFGFKNSLLGKVRANYSDTQWKSLMKSELDAGRPVLYAGFGSGGGHCFVTDGYDNNDYFHFNWGWSGYYDGYFTINALNPGGTGTGGGTGGFNSGHQAVIGIEPPTDTQTYDLKLNANVVPTTNPISYGQFFTVQTSIWNNGKSSFFGDIGAAVFDSNLNLIEFLETKTGITLNENFAINESFSTNGLLSMLPGTYYVSIFCKPTGGDWTIVEDNGNYINKAEMNVINHNFIELNSAISITNGTVLTKDQSATVILNIKNYGLTTFKGTFSVDLYDLKGNWVENIDEYTETSGLQIGRTYAPPYLSFSKSSITASPGTYYVEVKHREINKTFWSLTGSTYFQNPIYITVKLPELIVDPYEANNTVDQAANLALSFIDNTASIKTEGSNCNIGSDYDYYKVKLDNGYDYNVSAQLHDMNNSGNGNSYTIDALFSYSLDGVTWSDAYDYILPNNILIKNGGTVYFFVSPYFTGNTGTYLLDVIIIRTKNTALQQTLLDNSIKIYPNPAKNYVNVDLTEFDYQVEKISVINIHGQNFLYVKPNPSQSIIKLPLDNFSDGIYLVQFFSNKGLLTKKIIVRRQ